MKHRTDHISHRVADDRFLIRFRPNQSFFRFEGLIDGQRCAVGPTPESVRASLLRRALALVEV